MREPGHREKGAQICDGQTQYITKPYLSRNRYWGEREDTAYRAAICTSTLITGDGFRLLVDPPYDDAEGMVTELFRRTGLKPDAVTAAFLTHQHGDHLAGLKHFPHAAWFAAPTGARGLCGDAGRLSDCTQGL